MTPEIVGIVLTTGHVWAVKSRLAPINTSLYL